MGERLTGKVIIVTGAGSGIGAALSAGFVADGADVVGFDLDESGLQRTTAMCSKGMCCVTGNVKSDTDLERLTEAAMAIRGRIDVLINNAGIANQGDLIDRPFADWQAVIDVNLTGVARCTHAVLPGMMERRHGRIVNVCSREGEAGRRTLSAYSASKAGIAVLTKSLARELRKAGQDDVLVHGLIPGGTRTKMSSSDSMQPPEAVYPHTRFVVELPRGGPNGRVFFRSEDYEMFTSFNENELRPIPEEAVDVET